MPAERSSRLCRLSGTGIKLLRVLYCGKVASVWRAGAQAGRQTDRQAGGRAVRQEAGRQHEEEIAQTQCDVSCYQRHWQLLGVGEVRTSTAFVYISMRHHPNATLRTLRHGTIHPAGMHLPQPGYG
jgi:hypothetical protein